MWGVSLRVSSYVMGWVRARYVWVRVSMLVCEQPLCALVCAGFGCTSECIADGMGEDGGYVCVRVSEHM